ncbi:MAG: CZB domain-containing protein [Magnetococcales bacterium]|nr:CZB domain-containing protein [Magnetococcales bacterium]
MKQIDFGITRISHVVWESELEELVQHRRKTVHLSSHQNCELGIWLHGEGIRELYHLSPIRQLVDVHEKFHRSALHLLSLVSSSTPENVEKEMQLVRSLSRDIVYLITEAELDYLEHKPLEDFSAHPFKTMIHRLFNIHIPDFGDSGNRGVLEVSQARLMHLRWSRQLLKAFQHWGRDAILEPAEACFVGIWIREVGSLNRQYEASIRELDEKHQLFHQRAEETIRLLRRKSFRKSEEAYQDVVLLGREVLYLLTRIEMALLQSGEVTNPINLLGH